MKFSASQRAPSPPRGIRAIGVFLLFGTAMASLAGSTLIWPGTTLDKIWLLNPRAYREMAPLGKLAGVPLLLLAPVLASAAIGWFKRRRWGWYLAVGVIATQASGDVLNIFLRHFLEGAIGVAVAGALLVYLLRNDVKSFFWAKS